MSVAALGRFACPPLQLRTLSKAEKVHTNNYVSRIGLMWLLVVVAISGGHNTAPIPPSAHPLPLLLLLNPSPEVYGVAAGVWRVVVGGFGLLLGGLGGYHVRASSADGWAVGTGMAVDWIG